MALKAPAHTQLHGFALLLALLLTVPLSAYDDIPTSGNAIRDAYFLGTRQGNLTPEWDGRFPDLCGTRTSLRKPIPQRFRYPEGFGSAGAFPRRGKPL